MKKKLILCMIMGLGALLSCQKKDVKSSANAVSSGTIANAAFKQRTRSLFYSLLTQDPSDPTGNTWLGTYQGVNLIVSNLSYDQVKYPNNVDGIPATGNAGVYAGGGTIMQNYVQGFSSYFIIVVPISGLGTVTTDALSFINYDWNTFANQLMNWAVAFVTSGSSPAPPQPQITGTVQPTYSGSGPGGNWSVKTIICKLIRTSAGGWALADPGYPQPNPNNPIVASTRIRQITDPLTHIAYWIDGANGIITGIEASSFKISGSYAGNNITCTVARPDGSIFNISIIPDLGNFVATDTSSPSITYELFGSNGNLTSACTGTGCSVPITVSGAYTNTPATGIFHCWGTIIREDGSLFVFDQTQDTN